MLGRPPITTPAQAAAEYDRRRGRRWQRDAVLGAAGAMRAYADRQGLRGLVAIGALAEKHRPPGEPLDDLPPWWHEGLRLVTSELGPILEQPGAAVLRALVDPDRRQLIRALLRRDDTALLPPSVLPGMYEDAQRAFDAYLRPRARSANDAAQAFFYMTRVFFAAAYGVEPEASDLALLSGALGLESLDDGQDALRKIWEDRVRTWEPAMDTRWDPAWRASVPALATLFSTVGFPQNSFSTFPTNAVQRAFRGHD